MTKFFSGFEKRAWVTPVVGAGFGGAIGFLSTDYPTSLAQRADIEAQLKTENIDPTSPEYDIELQKRMKSVENRRKMIGTLAGAGIGGGLGFGIERLLAPKAVAAAAKVKAPPKPETMADRVMNALGIGEKEKAELSKAWTEISREIDKHHKI